MKKRNYIKDMYEAITEELNSTNKLQTTKDKYTKELKNIFKDNNINLIHEDLMNSAYNVNATLQVFTQEEFCYIVENINCRFYCKQLETIKYEDLKYFHKLELILCDMNNNANLDNKYVKEQYDKLYDFLMNYAQKHELDAMQTKFVFMI